MSAETFSFFYFVFTTKYRKGFMIGTVAEDIQRSMAGTAQKYGIQILALNIESDHLHLVIELPPTISPADAAQKLKWWSSVNVRRKHPDLQKHSAFWGRHYYVRAVSPDNVERAIEYVNGRQ